MACDSCCPVAGMSTRSGVSYNECSMNKARIFLLFSIFVVISAAVIFFVSRRQGAPAATLPSPEPTVRLLPPSLPSPQLGLPSVRYEAPSAPSALPKEAPGYRVIQQTNPAILAGQLASLFRFFGNPEVSESKEGSYYAWSSDQSGVLVGPGASRITYSSPHPQNLGPLASPDSDVVVLSQNLISSVSPGALSSSPQIRYYTTSSDRIIYTTRPQAKGIELTFVPLLDQLPLFSGQPQTSRAILRYDSTKTLRYFSSPVYRSIQKTGKTVSLVSYETILQRIARAEAILYHALAPQDISEPDTKFYSFSSVSITRFEIGLYIDQNSNTVFPVVVVYGITTDKVTNKEVETLSLVRATQ